MHDTIDSIASARLRLSYIIAGDVAMKYALAVLLLALPLTPSEAHATYIGPDAEAECKAIATTELSSCSCMGRYFEAKLGSDDGAPALHLVARSYTPEPQVTLTSLYERFGAAKLNKAAQRVLETNGEVAFFCPFAPHQAD